MANGKATNSIGVAQDEGDATTDPEVPAVTPGPKVEPVPPALLLFPGVGQSVLYVTTWGETLLASVHGVWGDGTVDVQVDGPDRHFAVSQAAYDATMQPGTWHWPEQG